MIRIRLCYVLSAPHFIQTLIHKDCPGFTLPQCSAEQWNLSCGRFLRGTALVLENCLNIFAVCRPRLSGPLTANVITQTSLTEGLFIVLCSPPLFLSSLGLCVWYRYEWGRKKLPRSVGACGYFHPSKQTSRQHFASLGGGGDFLQKEGKATEGAFRRWCKQSAVDTSWLPIDYQHHRAF